jgi:hypothetical protein
LLAGWLAYSPLSSFLSLLLTLLFRSRNPSFTTTKTTAAAAAATNDNDNKSSVKLRPNAAALGIKTSFAHTTTTLLPLLPSSRARSGIFFFLLFFFLRFSFGYFSARDNGPKYTYWPFGWEPTDGHDQKYKDMDMTYMGS